MPPDPDVLRGARERIRVRDSRMLHGPTGRSPLALRPPTGDAATERFAQPWEVAVVAAVSSQRSERLPRALLAYAVALAALTLVPPSLTASVGPPTGFTLQEAADLLTPIIVIPLAWYVFDLTGGLGRIGLVAFLIIAAVWIEGQAIHLAANAVGDAVPPGAVEAFLGTAPGDLNHWLDEFLSHWLWHVGWVAMSILLLAAASRAPGASAGRREHDGRGRRPHPWRQLLRRDRRRGHDAARHPGVDRAAGLERESGKARSRRPSGRGVLPRREHRDARRVRRMGCDTRRHAARVQQALIIGLSRSGGKFDGSFPGLWQCRRPGPGPGIQHRDVVGIAWAGTGVPG